MKYTTEQLKLIAMMFKIQHGDKTIGDIFPCCRDEQLKDIKIGELSINESRFALYNVDFLYNGELIVWFSGICQTLHPVFDIVTGIPIDDIIKMLSFEDKI